MTQTQAWRGMYKVIEEAGELLQELGKLGPFPSGAHPDGKGNLKDRIEDELADLQAACAYFAVINKLDIQKMKARTSMKIERFNRWGLTGIPTDQEPQK